MTHDDLIAFVRARLDEDEAVARAAFAAWDDEASEYEWADLPDEITRHAARHDPACVLRQTAAMRAVVGLHERLGGGVPFCVVCDAPEGIPGRPDGCDTLRHLAATWADHPDYRQEWAP